MSRCKCGSIPKKGTPPIVTLRLQDLASPRYFIGGVFIALPPPPSIFSIVWAESAGAFCAKDPNQLKDEFKPYSTLASTNALKKLWYKSCECAPQFGNYQITFFWTGLAVVNGQLVVVIRRGRTVSTEVGFMPKNLRIVRTPSIPPATDVEAFVDNAEGQPYMISRIVRDTGTDFRFRLDNFSLKFTPKGCFSPSVPPPPSAGDYPSPPNIPFPVPPSYYIPDETVPPPPKEKPPIIPPPPPPPECC